MPTKDTEHGPIKLGGFREAFCPTGRYLNDHCLIRHDGTWHFFGIVGPVGKGCYSDGSETSFAHATSEDLQVWQEQPDVMHIDGGGVDNAHVFAPHVMQKDDTFYMFYTGVDDRRRQRVCLATSTDLFEWHRFDHNPIIVPSLYWAQWPGFGTADTAVGNCRDSHILQLDDGGYVAYWVAELNDRFGTDMTCVAASISDDLLHWQEIGPIFSIRRWSDPPTAAAESPCVVHKDGHYWLFLKHGWQTHFVRGDTPFDFEGKEAVPLGYSHASEVFEWNDRWYITHCSGMPDEPEYKETNRTKGLFFGELDWADGQEPVLR